MSNVDPRSEEADGLFAEQLASFASTYYDMGLSDDEVRERCISFWERVLRPPGMFAAAAEQVSGLPQPQYESADETERKRQIREHFHVTPVEENLLSMMKARELLQQLAREFG